MWRKCIKPINDEFPYKQLPLISGTIPSTINGRLFRNGPGVLERGNVMVPHWFQGRGAILHIDILKGNMFAEFKHIRTTRFLKEETKQKLQSWNIFNLLYQKFKGQINYGNPANTSVLPLANSPFVYALCQSGFPYKLSKKDLTHHGFDDLNFLKGAFSAHPKVDPGNGDLYNIGLYKSTIKLYRTNKQIKLLAENELKYRDLQSIHDFALAGQYLVIFECPVKFNGLKMLTSGYFKALSYTNQYKTLVHIYKKQKLQKVAVLQADPFYCFHFSNGYSSENKIVLEYIKYQDKDVADLFQSLEKYPTVSRGNSIKSLPLGVFEQMTIDLETKSINQKIDRRNRVQFPVISDSDVGRNWEFTYAATTKDLGTDQYFNSILKKNRRKDSILVKSFGSDNAVSQPVLIQQENTLYLIVIVYDSQKDKSFVHLLDSNTLESISISELPMPVPNSFHGRWDYDNIQ